MIESLSTKVHSFARIYGFSKRETAVFHSLVAHGTKHVDLAKALDISPNTLRIHLRNMNQKVGSSGVSSLLRQFIEFSFMDNQLGTRIVSDVDETVSKTYQFSACQ